MSKRLLAIGIPKLDEAFPGFQSGDFTVLFGRHLCTMLSFRTSVRCQLPFRKGGLNSQVVYIDGGNTFDPYAVSAIAKEYGLEPQSVLEKILVSRAFTTHQLTELVLEKLEETLKKYKSKLVIISDITGLFLDRDMPKIEGRNLFLKMIEHLLNLVAKRRTIVVASYFPRHYSTANLFLEAILLEKAKTVIRLKQSRSGLRFILEGHQSIHHSTIDLPYNSVTMDRFMET